MQVLQLFLNTMRYNQLGKRGPDVSTVGFGAWAIGGMNWGPTEDSVSKRAIHEALDCGVTLLDTADVYGFGHSEELIAEVFAERGKGEVILATKAGSDFYQAIDQGLMTTEAVRPNYTRDYLISACERSLKRLGLETIDLLQLHSPGIDLLEQDEPWEALATLKQQGKIRMAGLSVQSFKETEQAHLLGRHKGLLDVIQVRYNLLEREAERVLFPKALEHGIGVIVRIPLLFGLLTGKFKRESTFSAADHRRLNLSPEKLESYLADLDRMKPLFDRYPDQSMGQVSLRFCLSHPACHTVIPGAKTREQVSANCAASDLGPIPSEQIPALEQSAG